MKKLVRYYYYMFYKIYKFIEYTSEQMGGVFWTDFKAGIVMIALEIWMWMSLFNYYTAITNIKLNLSFEEPIIYIPFTIIIGFAIYFFNSPNKWKLYFEKFDKLPKRKNRTGGWIVFGIIVLVVTNLIFSFYLLFSEAKKNHTGKYSKEYIEQQREKDSIDAVK